MDHRADPTQAWGCVILVSQIPGHSSHFPQWRRVQGDVWRSCLVRHPGLLLHAARKKPRCSSDFLLRGVRSIDCLRPQGRRTARGWVPRRGTRFQSWAGLGGVEGNTRQYKCASMHTHNCGMCNQGSTLTDLRTWISAR